MILRVQSDNKTKTSWNIIKNEAARMHPIEQVPSSLVNMGTLKDQKRVTNAFSNSTSKKLKRYKSEKRMLFRF